MHERARRRSDAPTGRDMRVVATTFALLLTLASDHARAWVATELVSRTAGGTPGNDSSFAPAISDDGRFVVFVSYATDLVAGDTNGFGDVFLADRETGVLERMSLAADGTTEGAGHSGFSLAMSSDARFVAFESAASNLVDVDDDGVTDIFVRDRVAGTLTRVSVDAPGVERDGRDPGISSDGTIVAYLRLSDGLETIHGGRGEVVVRDRNAATTTIAVEAFEHALSADGRWIAFSSALATLVDGDENGATDVFVYDRYGGAIERVSVAANGAESDADCSSPSDSADGRLVAFDGEPRWWPTMRTRHPTSSFATARPAPPCA